MQLPVNGHGHKRKIYLTVNHSEILVHIPYVPIIRMFQPENGKSDAIIKAFKLTLRERQVFDHLLRGLANKQIAYELNISERTVKFHVQQLFGKMPGIHRRTDIYRKFGVWPLDNGQSQ